MRQARPIDLSDFQSMNGWLGKLLSIPMRRYFAHGPVLWNYAYALIDRLPELDRQREMAEITRLLERVGFPKPQKRSTSSESSLPPNLEQTQR